jgi:hypothetical protein
MSAVDLSGVNVSVPTAVSVAAPAAASVLNAQFLQVLTELLQNKPQTKEDALALYHSVTVQLSAFLVSSLPPHEQKLAAMAMWAVQELDSSKCISAVWSCLPK